MWFEERNRKRDRGSLVVDLSNSRSPLLSFADLINLLSLDGQSRSNFAAAGAPSPSNAKLRSMERTYCESVHIL